MHHPRIRVAAYVIRYRTTPQLLVFDHVGLPEAGTQIPAGGVHPGEALDTAVLREVAEETGLTNVSIADRIAVDDHPHPLTNLPRRTTFYHLHAEPDTADAWLHQVHGEGADHGLTFACRFVPLPLEEPLADNQDRWLPLLSG
ncbi:NUDIX hydrolase [Nocardia cyriacigeorgica]|uniref:NUDIX hydrolase n=1 Tax=Nocardia cyriacigeorgica TaxID=135487 RepID=UPI0010328C0B|nr:NUDIX domain-containing protein [Nocardia cyriacigeorgica]